MTIFVNLVPATKLKEFFALVVFCFSVLFFYLGQAISGNFALDGNKEDLDKILKITEGYHDPTPIWFPHHWYGNIIKGFIVPEHPGCTISTLVLAALAIITVVSGYFLFEKLFFRGWMMANSLPSKSGANSYRMAAALKIIFPLNPQLRSLMYKDCLLYTSPSPRDATLSRMPSSA